MKFAIFTFLIISFFASENISARHLRDAETKNVGVNIELEKTVTENPDDDVDLEKVLEDYYDNLWHYKRILDQESKKLEAKEEEKKEKVMDYDYMSDMPAGQPEESDKSKKDEKEPCAKESGDSQSIDIARAIRESNSEEGVGERNKEMRLEYIKNQILNFRGGNPALNATLPDQVAPLREIYEKNMRRTKADDWPTPHTEKFLSFYPTCGLPRNTDEELWNKDSFGMNVFFDIDYPSHPVDTTVVVVTAKLKLYKIAQDNYSKVTANSGKLDSSTTALFPDDDENQIRVSIYWYTRSLKRHRVKRKLLDSRMVTASAPKWIEFNVRPAVRTWKESNRNFGLLVTVEDEDGTLLPVERYIHPMNCSKWAASVRPIPSIIMDEIGADDKDEQGYPFQPLHFPIIDLRTADVPNSEIPSLGLLNSAKAGMDIARRGSDTNDSLAAFLRKNNVNIEDVLNKQAMGRRGDGRTGEKRVSNFHNVPIGTPIKNGNPSLRKNSEETEGARVEDREQSSKTRHHRRHRHNLDLSE